MLDNVRDKVDGLVLEFSEAESPCHWGGYLAYMRERIDAVAERVKTTG